MIGEKGEYLNYIKKNLPKNSNFQYIKKSGSPTILKKRYIDECARFLLCIRVREK